MPLHAEIDDGLATSAVADAMHDDTIPNNDQQVEDDKEDEDTDHHITNNLVGIVVEPWERTLEDK